MMEIRKASIRVFRGWFRARLVPNRDGQVSAFVLHPVPTA